MSYTFEEICSMQKQKEYYDVFKKSKNWKNKKAVACIVDYRLGDAKKKTQICIPFKKYNEAKTLFEKTLKSDKSGKFKKAAVGVGTLEIVKTADGPKAKISIEKGALSPEVVQAKFADLFTSKLGLALEAVVATEESSEEQEIATEENTTLSSAKDLINRWKNEVKTVWMPQVSKESGASEDVFKDIHGKLASYADEIQNWLGEQEENASDKAQTALNTIFGNVQKLMPQLAKRFESVESTVDNSVEDVKQLTKDIMAKMKNNISAVVVPNVKAKQVGQDDADMMDDLYASINKIKDLYEGAEAEVQDQLKAYWDKVQTFVPKLDKIQSAVSSFLGVEEKTSTDNEEEVDTKQFIEDMKKSFSQIEKDVQQGVKAVGEVASEMIEGGAALLAKLF